MKSLHVTLNEATKSLALRCQFEYGHDSLWCKISDKNLLLQVAEILQSMDARVCMITAYALQENFELVYHFDVKGEMVNIKLHISDKSVPSITPLFKSADWTERELSEIYGITILSHPNPQRLFLDESIKDDVLKEYYSLSSAMNGALSKDLWEKVKAEKGAVHGEH